MLYELYVENIALIRQMRLPLQEGMNALTGETGAGKSLIIDAVLLLTGGRANDGLIRSGADKALVEGVFMPPFQDSVLEILGEGFDAEDNLVVSRELVRGGRSVARINGRVITISQLREVGRQLINIHGQHEHTLLLEDEQQRFLLDSFGGQPCADALEQVRSAYSELKAARAKLRDYQENAQARSQRMNDLAEQIDEIELVAPLAGEDDLLREESTLLSHGEKLYELAGTAHQELTGGALERMNRAATALRQAAQLDKNVAALSQRLDDLYYEVEDAASEISSYQGHINTDVYRLEEVESRLAKLGRLSKKHGGSIESTLAFLAAAKQEYNDLDEITISGEAFNKQVASAQAAYDEAADRLTHEREQAAAKLGAAITAELQLLAMEKAEFRVDLPACEPGPLGRERAEFMIRANLGEDYQPVSKIASGGELSRIVLGMKVILSQLDSVPTLIFDEIDTGMSGKALVSVAQRLALIGRYAQTICVSHAAVLAAAAENQIMIEKHEEDGRTIISTHTLSEAERVAELARMIAGDKAGETTLKQAEELLASMHT